MTYVFSKITNLKIVANYIYPDIMELKKENEDPCKAFFYLSIEVPDKKFTTELLDKRDAFFSYQSHAIFG